MISSSFRNSDGALSLTSSKGIAMAPARWASVYSTLLRPSTSLTLGFAAIRALTSARESCESPLTAALVVGVPGGGDCPLGAWSAAPAVHAASASSIPRQRTAITFLRNPLVDEISFAIHHLLGLDLLVRTKSSTRTLRYDETE